MSNCTQHACVVDTCARDPRRPTSMHALDHYNASSIPRARCMGDRRQLMAALSQCRKDQSGEPKARAAAACRRAELDVRRCLVAASEDGAEPRRGAPAGGAGARRCGAATLPLVTSQGCAVTGW
jgi:hypothetical protein